MEADTGTGRALGFGAFGFALGVALGFATGYLTPRPPEPPAFVVMTPAPTATTAPSPTPGPLRVYVTGAVIHPDVYELPPGSIVRDAINAAGGAAEDASLSAVNLAQELGDQQQVHVPRNAEVSGTPPPVSRSEGGTATSPTVGTLLNINTATAAELETLPRIGPTTAEAIIAHREDHGPFGTIEEIQEVRGIGEATFEGLRELITVD